MANHKSAEKRVCANANREKRNRIFLSAVKTAVKQFKVAFEVSENNDSLKEKYTKAQSMLSKAASKGILHRNSASHKIAKLTALLKKKV